MNSVIGSDFDLTRGYLSDRLSKKAGLQLQNDCNQHGTINEGEAVETDAHLIPCQKIIH